MNSSASGVSAETENSLFGSCQPTTRYHSLDALRAVALLLGIVLHSALAYIPGQGFGWAIQDRSTNLAFGALVFVLHSFRLEVFFLLAGFFARLLFERRGGLAFARNRLVRIGIPFVLGWTVVYPGLAFAWVWGAMKGDPAHMAAALKAVPGAVVGPFKGAWLFGSFPNFPLTHLWFLYYLLLIYAVFFALRWVVVLFLKRIDGFHARFSNAAGWLIGSRWLLPALAAATFLPLLGMREWGVDTPDRSFVPLLPVYAVYGLAFTFGWLLHIHRASLIVFEQKSWSRLGWAALLTLPVLGLVGLQYQKNVPDLAAARVVHQALYAFMMWAFALGLLGLFLKWISTASPFWRYLSDASYTVYIIHLPLVVALQVALAPFSISCWVKFVLINGVTVLATLLVYHLLVRSTPIGTLLNGRRYPFTLRPQVQRPKGSPGLAISSGVLETQRITPNS